MPTVKEWGGHGLPPVGTTCIAHVRDSIERLGASMRVLVDIKAYDDDHVWILAARTQYMTKRIDLVDFSVAKKEVLERRAISTADLKNGLWFMRNCSQTDAWVLSALGLELLSHPVHWDKENTRTLQMLGPKVSRVSEPTLADSREIHRKGLYFYWGPAE
mgnify:CR=1 FL=1